MAKRKTPPPPLHELEALVMDEVWRQGQATVREVLTALNRDTKERAYTTVMTDLNLTVSDAYSTPDYRMAGMSESFNGHSFLLVAQDGTIEWRADYGGPSTGNTMYVPVDSLLTDIERGINGASS